MNKPSCLAEHQWPAAVWPGTPARAMRVTKCLLAGGTHGTADGQGAAAQFNNPNIALGPDGCIYVGDQGNGAIRKVSGDGTVTTLAGQCDPSNSNEAPVDGVGGAARFSAWWSITRIAVDALGNVYAVDNTAGGLRKIDPRGVVSTLMTPADFAGDGPIGVAVDGNGNIYVTAGNRVLKRDPRGQVTTLAGAAHGDPSADGYLDGLGGAARFSALYGIAVAASGDLYVADAGNHRIRKITGSGVVSSVGETLPNYPVGIAVDGAGNIYVADGGILKFDANGQPLALVEGGRQALAFGYANSVAVAADGTIYVGDAGHNRIERLIPLAASDAEVAGLPAY